MESFERIFQQYEPMIWSIIHSLSIYKHKDEFYQTGLIALWEASQNYDCRKGNFTAFAYSYIRGRILTDLASRRKYEDKYAVVKDEFWDYYTENTPIKSLERDDILAYCSGLSDSQRKWYLYTALADLSIKQIAEIENVSVSAVKAWRKGARKKLIQVIKKENT